MVIVANVVLLQIVGPDCSALVSKSRLRPKRIVDKLSTEHALSFFNSKRKTSNTLFIELFYELTTEKIGSIVRLKSCSTYCL